MRSHRASTIGWAIACALAVLLRSAAPSAADPRPPPAMSAAARSRLEAGMALFERGRYAEAVAEFDAGYAIEAHPDFLYARAQALRLSNDCARAIDSYQRFLESSPPAEEERLARQNLARCEQLLAAQRAATPPPASQPTPLPAPAPAPATPRAPPFYLDPLGDTLFVGGLVGVATSIGFLLVADSHVDSANNSDTVSRWRSERDAAHRARVIGGISLGVGSAAVAGALARWIFFPRGPEIGASADRERAQLWVGGRF
jgi:tetratricopeptide (TPR) repeat protein